MRKYGKVSTALFTDPKSLAWDDLTFRLAIYLLAGPHANLIGCFRLPVGYLAEDLAKPKARVKRSLDKLKGDGWLDYCTDTSWVWIKKFILHNQFETPNVAKAAMATVLAVPKQLCFYDEFITKTETYGHWEWDKAGNIFNLNAGLSETIAQPNANSRAPVPEPEPEPEPNQSHIQNQSQNQKETNKEKASGLVPAPLPSNLNMEAWIKWLDHRRRNRKPAYKTNKMAEDLAILTHSKQAECVEYSITREYAGLFPDKFKSVDKADMVETYHQLKEEFNNER